MELKTNIDSGDVTIKRNEDGSTSVVKKDTGEVVSKDPDLVTRVSQVKAKEEADESNEANPDEEAKFDYKELENIKDPEAAKAWAEKAYKSFQRGAGQKYTEIAELRKQLSDQANQIASLQKQPDTWTAEKLQSVMNDPNFVAAAQQVLQTQQTEDDSLMSEAEKAQRQKVAQLERELSAIKQQNFSAQKQTQDEQLKTKYANYNPQAVDILTSDMISGKVQATREHLWKAMDYDDAVNRAYRLGLEDRKLDNQDKINSMSAEGVDAQTQEGALPREEKETGQQWFVRNALNRLVQSKKQTSKK